MGESKLYVAAAGSGKTRHIIESAINKKDRKILITTFTDNNTDSIKDRIIEKKGYIPSNLTIQPWYSFLIQHGVKPYLTCLTKEDFYVAGLYLINENPKPKKNVKAEDKAYYFDKYNKIYSTRLSDFVVKCNELSDNLIIKRLEELYDIIFIDEIQDLAGYDFDFIKLLIEKTSIKLCLVGDPRQKTYRTTNSSKNKGYKTIIDFIEKLKIEKIKIDDTKFNRSYRCNKAICDLSSKVYLNEYPAILFNEEIQSISPEHDGILVMASNNIDEYMRTFPNTILLRHDKSAQINEKYKPMNFGDSKGLEWDRVIIYPTSGIKKWLKNHSSDLKEKTKSKLYVAITRARFSVVFIDDSNWSSNDIKRIPF